MKQFTIIYARQVSFGQGFSAHIERVVGAKAALQVLKSIRKGQNPALMVRISVS